MEYNETPDGQIQADFARRVGQVLLHYEAGMAQMKPVVKFWRGLHMSADKTVLLINSMPGAPL
jgi:hypothetical protein